MTAQDRVRWWLLIPAVLLVLLAVYGPLIDWPFWISAALRWLPIELLVASIVANLWITAPKAHNAPRNVHEAALAILDRWEHHMDHPDGIAPLEIHHRDIWTLRDAITGKGKDRP